MRIGFAQINPTVGDLRGNTEKILNAYRRLAAAGAELVLAPELATTGYPPQDLVFKSRFVPQNLEAIAQLHGCIGEVPLLVGYVDRNEGSGKPFFNAAALLERGQPIRKSFKTLLPTYDVFDEDRYFEPGKGGEVFTIGGRRIGVTICEDIWTSSYLPRPLYDDRPFPASSIAEAEIIVNLSASPFGLGKVAVAAARCLPASRARSSVRFSIATRLAETTSSSSTAARSRSGATANALPVAFLRHRGSGG